MPEEVEAVSGREGVEGGGSGAAQGEEGSASGLAQEGFEFGEGQFDGVEVRAVGREVEQLGSASRDGLRSSANFVAGEVIADDQVARGQFRGEDLLEVGDEHRAIHWPINEQRRAEPVMAQRGDEGIGLPMTVRDRAQAASTPVGPAIQAGHLGVESSLIQEDQPAHFPLQALLPPNGTRVPQFRPVLFGGAQRFF